MLTPSIKKLIALTCIIAFMMSPSVSFAGNTWKKIKNHFKNCEIKIQGATTEQWATILNPKKKALYANSAVKNSKLTTNSKVLIGIATAVVVVGIIYVVAKNNHDNKPSNSI